MTKSPAEYGRLYGGAKKQRTTTPFLGKENPRRKMTTPVFTANQEAINKNFNNKNKNYNSYLGRKNQASVQSNINRRSTLSKDYDISTQRRHSNDASRLEGEVGDTAGSELQAQDQRAMPAAKDGAELASQKKTASGQAGV